MSIKSFRILIVCTGNTCRSPMAEGILKKKLSDAGEDGVWVSSAGTSGLIGAAASKEAVTAAKSFGVDISSHKSSSLSKQLLQKANIILVMTEVHRQLILEALPEAKSKTFLLSNFSSSDIEEIPDPIGASQDEYMRCTEMITKCLDGLGNRLSEMKEKFTHEIVDFAVGVDHRGFLLKDKFLDILSGMNLTWEDFGTFSGESIDYPQFAFAAGEAVVSGKALRGALVCGTGIGMALAANKVIGIRAAVVTNTFLAEKSRSHNNCNVIVLCEDLTEEQMKEILTTWMTTEFEGGRHGRRIDQIMDYERRHRSG